MIPDLTIMERFQHDNVSLFEWLTAEFGPSEINVFKSNCNYIYRPYIWFMTDYKCDPYTISSSLENRESILLVITFKRYALL